MGELVWDDEFTVAPTENQVALLEFCDYLVNESELVADNLVECWISDMDKWIKKISDDEKSLPIKDEAEFTEMLFRFVNEEPAGIEAARQKKLGFIDTEKTEDYKFDKKL